MNDNVVRLVPFLLILVLAAVVVICYVRWRPTPPDPGFSVHVHDAYALLVRGGKLIRPDGDWSDSYQGRVVFQKLRALDRDIYLAALAAVVKAPTTDHEAITVLAIRLGRTGSEDILLSALRRSRDISLAEFFLNSGSPDLHHGAVKWAARHNCRIRRRRGDAGPAWGRF